MYLPHSSHHISSPLAVNEIVAENQQYYDQGYALQPEAAQTTPQYVIATQNTDPAAGEQVLQFPIPGPVYDQYCTVQQQAQVYQSPSVHYVADQSLSMPAGTPYDYYTANYGIPQTHTYNTYMQSMQLYGNFKMHAGSLQPQYFTTPVDVPPGTYTPVAMPQPHPALIQSAPTALQPIPEVTATSTKIALKPTPSSFKRKKILKPSPLDNMEDQKDTVKSHPEQPESEQKKSDSWPESLRDYAIRVFDSCPAHLTSVVEKKIKDIIIQAINKKIIWMINWDKMPLLEECITDEKRSESPNKQKNPAVKSKFSKSNKKVKAVKTPSKPPDEQVEPPDESKMKKSKPQSIYDPPVYVDISKEIFARKERKKRFKLDETSQMDVVLSSTPSQLSEKLPDPEDFDIIRGTCTNLEKNYLRLTSAPDKSSVRPPEIIEKAFLLILEKWELEHNYTYACDQLKSIRQDLMVQHIKSDLTVKIYEAHARISLQMGDLGEFNQCLGQLTQLYTTNNFRVSWEEFTAYRILYNVLIRNKAEIMKIMDTLTDEQKNNPAILHALNVRASLSTRNFDSFFKLYNNSPNMGRYLISHMVDRERVNAVSQICKAYRPSIPLHFLTRHLGHINMDGVQQLDQSIMDTGLNECFKWMKDKNAVMVQNNALATLDISSILIDTKQSLPIFTQHVVQYRRKGVDLKGQIH